MAFSRSHSEGQDQTWGVLSLRVSEATILDGTGCRFLYRPPTVHFQHRTQSELTDTNSDTYTQVLAHTHSGMYSHLYTHTHTETQKCRHRHTLA